ncbi:MAG TPA: hypothetical protein VFX02_14120 [Gammaproteobacteria bacterium]|nr:hypothetical protein [Gammaproteobacteria bacterium]
MNRIICILLVMSICGCGENCSDIYGLKEGSRYEEYMKAAKVYPLCTTSSPDNEKYRFVWLRSHDNPIVVTMIKDSGKAEVNAIRLDGGSDGKPGEVMETRMYLISLEEFERFKLYIDGMDFWNMKPMSRLGEGSAEAGGNDSRWVLEGATNKRAHSVDRGSGIYGNFRDAALFLVDKSGININGEAY